MRNTARRHGNSQRVLSASLSPPTRQHHWCPDCASTGRQPKSSHAVLTIPTLGRWRFFKRIAAKTPQTATRLKRSDDVFTTYGKADFAIPAITSKRKAVTAAVRASVANSAGECLSPRSWERDSATIHTRRRQKIILTSCMRVRHARTGESGRTRTGSGGATPPCQRASGGRLNIAPRSNNTVPKTIDVGCSRHVT